MEYMEDPEANPLIQDPEFYVNIGSGFQSGHPHYPKNSQDSQDVKKSRDIRFKLKIDEN